ncbi:MAG: hypothetical protein HY922_14895 [Elusimicrobia bacterium]|nr:hypothetical protein [Elusimicrobiota bacterium]
MPGRLARERLIAGLAVAAAVWAVYFIVLSAPVLTFDDFLFIQRNPIYQLPFADFWRQLASLQYFQFSHERTYQPLTTLLHFPIHRDPAAYRALGIGLHAANAYLVYELGRRLSLQRGAALAAALLFALFPAHTEAVNISIFKGHLLAFFFSLLTLLSWMDGSKLALSCAFVAALLSKETGLLALGLVSAYAVCFEREKLPWHLKRGGALLILAAAYLWFRFRLLAPAAVLPAEQLPAWSPALPAAAFGWYLKALLIPYPLCLMHTLSQSRLLFLLLPFYAFLLWRWRARPMRAFLLSWILISLLPYLHLIPFADSGSMVPSASYTLVADRYLYGACAGSCLLLISLLYETRARFLLAALALCWGLLSVLRSGLYRDWGGLCRQSAACAPQNAAAQVLLASYYYSTEHDYTKALAAYEIAFGLQPSIRVDFMDPGLTHSQGSGYVLGLLRLRLRDPAGAQRLLAAAALVENEPSAKAALHEKLGDVYSALGKEKEALAQYRRALESAPGWFMPFMKYGASLLKKRPQEAAALLVQAQALIPSGDEGDSALRTRLDCLLAESYRSTGKVSLALRAWESADKRSPGQLDILIPLAETYARAGRKAEATAAYERAAREIEAAIERIRGLSKGLMKTEDAKKLLEQLQRRRLEIRRAFDRLKH